MDDIIIVLSDFVNFIGIRCLIRILFSYTNLNSIYFLLKRMDDIINVLSDFVNFIGINFLQKLLLDAFYILSYIFYIQCIDSL